MNAKIINTKDFEKRAFNLFFDRVDKGDYLGALGIMYSRYLKDRKDKEVIKNLADLYSKMEEYARALFFRFKLLSLSSKEDRLYVYKDIILDFDAFENVVISNYYLNKVFDDYGKQGVSEIAVELGEKLNPKPNLEPFYVAYPHTEKHYKRLLFCASQAVNATSTEMAHVFYDKVPLEHFTDNDVRDYITTFIIDEDFDNAIKKLKEFWAVMGDSVCIFSNMALCYKHLKNQEKFEYYLSRALELFSGDKVEALDLYEIIKGANPIERYLEVLSVLVKEYKYSAEYHAVFAEYLYVFGDTERAVKEISIARQIEPENKDFLYKERTIQKINETEKEDKNGTKKAGKSNKTESLTGLEACVYSQKTRFAKGAVYTLIEKGSVEALRILDDALLDLELDGEIKHTIIYAKISYGYLGTISVVIDGVFYEIRPKKLYPEAQKSTFYTSCYALVISKTFTSSMATENDLKNATNLVYKTLKDRFKGEEELRDISALICILAIKDMDSDVLISNFGANPEKVLKYLSLVKENKTKKGEEND